jgi:membrane fusion protein (multidrug efflux system)
MEISVDGMCLYTEFLPSMNVLLKWCGILAGLTLTGCGGESKQQAAIVPDVSVVEVGQKTLPVYSEYVGQTYGQSDVEIRPRVEGWLQKINFKEGSQVKAGQLLYVIQDDQLLDRKNQAQARLDEAKVMLVKAKSDLDRVRPLTEMNALSQRDLDAAQATYDAQIQAVGAADAGLQFSRTELSYSRIMAPISGVIGVSNQLVGDYVQKDPTKPPLNTISALGAMRVRFNITESDYLKFRRTMTQQKADHIPVDLILNDGTVFPEKGRLDFINRQIDPTTGSLLVQALVPNSSGLLKPGQYVRVRFESDEIPNAVIVPQQAINQMQTNYMAYVVGDSDKIIPTPVKTGSRVGSNWVITDGLKPGQRIALIGNALIKPNTRVNPIPTNYSYDSTSTGQ